MMMGCNTFLEKCLIVSEMGERRFEKGLKKRNASESEEKRERRVQEALDNPDDFKDYNHHNSP